MVRLRIHLHSLSHLRLREICGFARLYNSISNKVVSHPGLKMHNGEQKPLQNNASKLSSNKDHLQVTASQQRDSGIHEVYVSKISNLSSSVKELELSSCIKPVPLSFKPGQWVDLFIPGVEKVGGFSMTSSPKKLSEEGSLLLAVKYSDHPPAKWVHTQCREGDKVTIRVGGDFFLDLDNLPVNKKTHIILIAGGVGINPLASMISAIDDYHVSLSAKIGKIVLFYSAKTSEELIFKEKFDSLIQRNPSFQVLYFLTNSSAELTFPFSKDKRITTSDLRETLVRANVIPVGESEDVLCYICGPSDMIKFADSALRSFNVESIHYEKWWKDTDSDD